MKLLFYSSDVSEVELASGQFVEAGISCEVRCPTPFQGITFTEPCAELWIHRDKDSNRASMLCVRLGIGFSRRQQDRGPIDMELEDESLRGPDEMDSFDFEPRSRSMG